MCIQNHTYEPKIWQIQSDCSISAWRTGPSLYLPFSYSCYLFCIFPSLSSPSFSVCLIFNYILGFCIQVSQIPCRHTDRSCIVSDTTPAGQLHWSCTSFPVEFIQHVCFCECERAKESIYLLLFRVFLCFVSVLSVFGSAFLCRTDEEFLYLSRKNKLANTFISTKFLIFCVSKF